MMTTLGKFTWFLTGSAKRKSILLKSVKDGSDKDFNFDVLDDREDDVFSSGKGRKSITLCETRWSARIDSLTWLMRNYGSVMEALDTIIEESSSQSASDGRSYREAILAFEFISAVVCAQFLLGYLKPLTIALQAKDCDLVYAHSEAQTLVSVLQDLRGNVDERFHALYLRSCNIASEFEVQPTRPRATGRQRHRANAPAGSIEDHYKVNMFIPFLDHVIQHLTERFPPDLVGPLYGFYLIPAFIDKLTEDIIQTVEDTFQDELPSPDEFTQEIEKWIELCSKDNIKPISTLIETLAIALKQYYPNVNAILELLIALPVGTCSCERSFSSLRRLKHGLDRPCQRHDFAD
ncbi:hypothetical protein KUTeg_013291 [Tegillarca granosa]|uniref:HAT C-terminal dimerisation domain-containing protein n=1 Tax=Tegillarca granosa TaxID=220873 RepID=A0ABQ9EWQ5_TEGGR|nr:hypothetical protein KUTeg_013291 [Tegillarca granosa]